MSRSSRYSMAGFVLLEFFLGTSSGCSGQGPAAGAADAASLFSRLPDNPESPNQNFGKNRKEVVRVEFVSVNLPLIDKIAFLAALKAIQQGGAPPRVQLRFFGGDPRSVTLDRLSQSEDGSVSWGGRMDGELLSSVVFAVTDQVVSGTFKTEQGESYELRYVAPGIFAILQIDESRFPPEEEPIFVDATRAPVPQFSADIRRPSIAGAGGVAKAADDGSTMDVLVVYTPSVRDAAGGVSAVENLISLAVTEANQGYENSGVIQRLRVVHSEVVPYSENAAGGPDSFTNALNDLTNQAKATHNLRDQYHADFVSLWINDQRSCGLAWIMSPESPSFEAWAFSVVHYSCATGYYSFAHEMGHNQGVGHDRANAGKSPYARPYAYGFSQAGPVAFRTVMAYGSSCGNCTRRNYWSNPTISLEGSPTGVDGSQPNSADNARALNETRLTAANFR